jgi:Fe-S-cluster containining protein
MIQLQPGRRHFRCTECGACCNRSPEVGLSEAAPLSDQFVFRLTFRLYRFAKNVSDRASLGPNYASKNAFLEQRRHVELFASRKNSVKTKSSGRSVDCNQYLVTSALPLDIPPGICAALHDGRCGIYERRPLSCRTVPAHYSRAEALAERDFDEFTQRPGYRCDTDQSSEIILDDGRIVKRDIVDARARAVDLAISDQAWNAAILERMTSNTEEQASLPSLKEIQDNALYGAMTTSMRVAWQIARDSDLLDTTSYLKVLHNQLRLIEREIVMARASRDDLDTLAKMQVEYKHCVQYK